MNVWEMIKSDRKLSLNHWRYRLLHWFFCVESRYVLPQMFYTHYCPLFHMTNLIVAISPVVLLIRCFYFYMVKPIAYAVTRLFQLASNCIPSYPIDKSAARRHQELLYLTCCIEGNECYLTDFERLYRVHQTMFVEYSEEELKVLWVQVVANYQARIERAKYMKAKLYDRVIYAVNMSRILFKCAFNVLYAVLFCAVLYAIYKMHKPAYELFLFAGQVLQEINWRDFLEMLGILTMSMVACYFAYSMLQFIPSSNTVRETKTYAWITRFMEYVENLIYNCAVSVKNFVSILYEENCPSITLEEDVPATEHASEVQEEANG